MRRIASTAKQLLGEVLNVSRKRVKNDTGKRYQIC